uniref:MADS-box domain-containing protein n=1 Tax=Setaria italica TaxID=4555 RepID=K3YLQ3_SETIT
MAQSQTSFSEHTNTLFSMAKDLSQEFGAHIAVVTFSPTSKPKAYGAPTGDSVLSTYLLEIHSSPSPASSETAGEAAARVDGMKWEAKETAFLAEAERAPLGADIVLVFVRALGMLRTNVQRHFDTIKSSRKEKMQP